MNWKAMDSAPKDGTVITGKDADGNEAEIEYRPVHPKTPTVRTWFVAGGGEKQGNWIVSKTFRPVAWRKGIPS